MIQLEDKLITMLRDGANVLKLKTKTELCDSDLTRKIRALENKGYIINKVFNEYGVKYKIGDNLNASLHDNFAISTGTKFTFLTIADTHIGNKYENMQLVNNIYKYALDNNIRYVIHLGDMIEGTALNDKPDDRLKRIDINEQIDYLTRYYPKHDTINTLYILGNHDYRCVSKGIDISKTIENRRLDMHFLGYKNSKIQLGKTDILLQHPFAIERDNKYDKEIIEMYPGESFDLVLRGHTHHNGIYVNDFGSIVVNVPACYNSPTRKYVSAYEITLKENELELDNLIIDDEVSKFSVIKYPLKTKTLGSK